MPEYEPRRQTAFFVDISGSMGDRQITAAMDRVSIDWRLEDLVFIFDKSQYEKISFEDVIEYTMGEDPYRLRMILFKKGAASRWSGNGAFKATCDPRTFTTRKVCITDGKLSSHDWNFFNAVTKLGYDDLRETRPNPNWHR